ncbi:MAG: WG repeat-containing protein, partial [Bacteroidia bacterium]
GKYIRWFNIKNEPQKPKLKNGGFIIDINYINDINIICKNSNNKTNFYSLKNQDTVYNIKAYSQLDTTGYLTFETKFFSGIYHPTKGLIYTGKKSLAKSKLNITGNILISENSTYGLIDTNGTEILATEYGSIVFRGNYYEVRLNGYMGIFSTNGKPILAPIYSNITLHSENLFIIERLEKTGIAKTDGTIIIKPKHTDIEIERNQIRGIDGNGITFYDLDRAKNVLDIYRFKNVKTVTLDARIKLAKDNNKADKPLQFGWYREQNGINWGFRRPDSSLRHTPKFYKLNHYNRKGYTVTFEKIAANKEQEVLDGYYYQKKKCAVAFTANGNYFITPKYWHIYVSELKNPNCSYLRGLTFAGTQKVILKNGVELSQNFTFIDTLTENMARFAIGGKPKVHDNQKLKTAVCNQLVYKHQNGIDSNTMTPWNKSEFRKKRIEISYAKWGVLDNSGNIVIEPKFEFIEPFYKGKAIAKYNGKWGVINKDGEFIIKPQFYNIERIERNDQVFFHVYKPRPRFGIIDSTGKTIVYPEYKGAKNFVNGLLAIKTKSGWTFIDTNLIPIHDAVFEEVKNFKNQRAAVKKGNKWGFLSTSGTLVIPCIYQDVHNFSGNKTWAKTRGKWIIIDKNGLQSGNKTYKYPTHFVNDHSFAKTEKSARFRLVDSDAKFVNNKRYQRVTEFNKYGVAIIQKKGFKALINQNGKYVTKFNYTKIDSFYSGWAYASNHNGLVMLHYSGKHIDLNDDYYDFMPFAEGRSLLKLNGAYGFIDTSGQVVVPFEYSKATEYKNGYAFVKKPGYKPQCININGQVVFDFNGWVQYPFQNGLAILKQKGKYIYIDTTGSAVFDHGFKKALPFSKDVGRVKLGKKWAVINKNGQILNTPKYKKIKGFKTKYSIVKRSGSYGLFNNSGKVVLDVMYDELDLNNEYYFFLSVNDRIGHYHITKGWVWQPEK